MEHTHVKESWCPILNVVREIANTYCDLKGDFGNYVFEEWVEELKQRKQREDLLKIIDPLQINQRGDLILIRFGLAEMQDKGGEMWSDEYSVYRECRSVVIDIKDFEVVQAPFRKFFNLNEVEENTTERVLEEISHGCIVEITNKLDGSMQCATVYKGDVLLTGSMALSPTDSWRLQEGYSMLTENYQRMIKTFPKYTFIFEYISLKDPHVVIYKSHEQGMYLIGMRNKETGKELSYHAMAIYARQFAVPMTKIESITFEEAMKKSKEFTSDEKEGWVLNIDGHRIKLKCEDYVKLHRVLNDITSVNVVIEAIADEKYDDVYSKVPKGYKPKIEELAKTIFRYKVETERIVNNYYNLIKDLEKVEAMLYVNENVHKFFQTYVRNLYFGKQINVLKTQSRYKKMKEIEEVMGFVKEN